MAKKIESLQIRCSQEEKESIKLQAEKFNLSVSQYALKCIKEKGNFVSIYDSLESKIELIREQNDNQFYYLKEDLEELKNKENTASKKEYIEIKLSNKEDVSNYKIDDILVANEKSFIVEAILENGLGVKSLLTTNTSKINTENLSQVEKILRKVEV